MGPIVLLLLQDLSVCRASRSRSCQILLLKLTAKIGIIDKVELRFELIRPVLVVYRSQITD